MSEVKFCPQCGKKIENDERFCGECGFDSASPQHFEERVNPILEPPSDSSADTRVTMPSKSPPAKSSNTAVIAVIAVLGGVFIIGGMLFWWFSSGHNLFGKAGGTTTGQTAQSGQTTLGLPSYSLNEGSYTGEQTVAINKPGGEGVQVYYSIDGSEPTAQSLLYQNPLVLKGNTTLKSRAIDSKGNQSEIKTATYTITTPQTTTPQTTTPQTTTPPAASDSVERAQFEGNITGVWELRETSGFVLYYQFYNGEVIITDGGMDYYKAPYTFTIQPGNNGTIGTVTAGTQTINIDCNPLGDNAIYINGYAATYSP